MAIGLAAVADEAKGTLMFRSSAIAPEGGDAIRIGHHVFRVVSLAVNTGPRSAWDASFEVCFTRDGEYFVWFACARQRDSRQWDTLLLWSAGGKHRRTLSETELVEFVDQILVAYGVHAVGGSTASAAFERHFAAWWQENGQAPWALPSFWHGTSAASQIEAVSG